MTGKRVCLIFILGLALAWSGLTINPPPARAFLGDSESCFGLDGSFKTFVYMYDYNRLSSILAGDESADVQADAVLRLIAAGRPTEQLNYEIHLIQGLNYSSADTDGALFSGQTKSRYKALDDAWNSNLDGEVDSSFRLDRFNIKYSLARADVTIGRQAITFGKAYFWNPLDVYLPFDPQTLDRDYKAGVDAVRLDIPLGNFSGLNLIGVFGREITPEGEYENEDERIDSSWYGSSLLARVFANAADWDLAVQLGKIYGGYQIGFGAVGEIKNLEIRFELAGFRVSDSRPLPAPCRGDFLENHWTAVAGIGRRLENSLTFELEYLYNGAGDDDNLEASLARLTHGSIAHMSEHLLGFMASYEIAPIFTAQLVCLYSISDRSGRFQPTFFLSLADEVELIFGATLSRGEPSEIVFNPLTFTATPRINSEFGLYPDVYFIELKIYF